MSTCLMHTELGHPGLGSRQRGPVQYAEIAIETGHLLRLAFGRPWRQTEGLP